MKKFIIIKFQYEGLHYWPKPNLPQVLYLQNTHRHMFHITCKKEVEHSDRQIEIITFKNEVIDYLRRAFNKSFGSWSCEHIAEHLLETFELNSCEVLEDGENGAVAVRNAQDELQKPA